MRKYFLLIIVFALLAVCLLCVPSTSARAEDEIVLSFASGNATLVPEMDGEVYVLEYQNRMRLTVTGSFGDERETTSKMYLKENGIFSETVNLTACGTYNLRIKVTYGDKNISVSKDFKLRIEKQTIQNIQFESDSLSIEYGVPLSPQLSYDAVLDDEAVVSRFTYYNSLMEPIDPPTEVGDYYVSGEVESKKPWTR